MLFQLPSTVPVMLSQLLALYWLFCPNCPALVAILNILVAIISLLGLLLGHEVYILCVCAAASVMLCVAERTPTPEVKKATTFPAPSHKPLLVDRPLGAFQNTQRPLPPTPGDSKLSEKPNGEL